MNMDTALIRQRFCAASASYDAEAQAQQHIAARLWALTAPHLAAGADVLEIGAGTGLLTRLILNAQPRSLTLNDLYISPQLEALAQELAQAPRQALGQEFGQALGQELGREQSATVLCREGDAEQLVFGKSYDAVLSASTVQWFADLPGFFARCAQMLPRGGLLAFSSFLPGNLQEVADLTGVGLNYCTAAELQAKLARHFDLLAMEQGEMTLHFATPRDVLLHLRHTGVTGIRSVVWGKNSYKNFVARYAERYSTEQGVRLTYRPVYVVAANRATP